MSDTAPQASSTETASQAAPVARNDFADRAAQANFTDGTPRPSGRVISPTTRAAFQTAAQAVKKAVDEGGLDDMEPAIQTGDAPAGASAQQAASSAPSPQATAGAPSPEHVAITAHHEAMARQLAEREQKIADAEKQRRDYLDRFRDDPIDTLKTMIREAHGIGDDPKEIRRLAAELVSDISADVLELEVPDSVKAKNQTRKAERLIKQHNDRIAKDEAERKKQKEDLDRQQRDIVAQNHLRREIEAAKTTFPYLSLEDEPHMLVWQVAEELLKRDPQWRPDWKDAAAKAETYLKDQASAYYGKRKHLLQPESSPKNPNGAQTHQERPPGSRSSVTLTNGDAAESSPNAPQARPMTTEERRKASLAKLKFRDD